MPRAIQPFLPLILLALAACSAPEPEPEPGPKPSAPQPAAAAAQATYGTPEAAGAALAAAVRGGSGVALTTVLGPEAQELLQSGDPVQDRNDRQRFIERYEHRHATRLNADGSATLLVGDDDWPFPIPLVRTTAGSWRFDAERGVDELLSRRIGANELSTIEVCRAIVDAQREYRSLDPEGKGCYASTFFSDPGRRNGLYWATEPDEPPSPMGERVAQASREGYKRDPKGPAPYHGYLYGLLLSQGPSAPGGARNYMDDGNLTGGFAVVAWPAEYGQSGVMTFLVGSDGIVYERDLGEDTAEIASAMDTYDPDESWAVCEVAE